jgi:hypothetical protein
MSASGCEKGSRLRGAVNRPLWTLAIAAALVPGAAVRAAEPPPSGQVLGAVEAIVEHCIKADAASAARYAQQLKIVVRDADEKALAEVRQSDEYKQTYQATKEQLGESTGEEARRACASSLSDTK